MSTIAVPLKSEGPAILITATSETLMSDVVTSTAELSLLIVKSFVVELNAYTSSPKYVAYYYIFLV